MSTALSDRFTLVKHRELGLLSRARRVLAVVSFWCAVVLPTAYLPLMIAGVNSTRKVALFTLLVTVHALTLIFGHGHGDGHASE